MRHSTWGAAAALAIALASWPSPAGAESPLAAAQKLLASKDWAERLKALDELAALGRSADTEKAVLSALDDEDWGVEVAACKTLVKVGADPAKEALARLAIDGEIQWVRDAAVDALRELDPEGGGMRLLERAKGAAQKDDGTRERAYVAAGRAGGKDVLKKLTFQAGTKNVSAATAALRGVALLAGQESTAVEILAAAEPALSQRADKKNFFLYAAAIDAIGRVPGPAAAGTLVTEIVQQPDDDLYVQERVARGLEKRPPEELANLLHTGFAQAKKPDEQRRVARLAGRIACAGAREDLEALLAAKDERVRSEAAAALGRLRLPAAAAALTKLLDDKSPYVRVEAVTALARALPPAEFRALGARIRKDPVELIRLQFIVEISDAGDPAGIGEIEPLLSDAGWRVASAAAAAIGTLGVADDLPKLEPLLTHKLWQVRGAAFEGLGRLRAAKAIPLLTEGLRDKDPVVRGVCHANLQILTREKLASDPAVWREWWAKNGSGLLLVKQSRRTDAEKKTEDEKNSRYAKMRITQDKGVEILQKARIVVVTGAWDKVQIVLGHLAIPHTLLRAQQLKDQGLNPNQTILVNCEGNMDKDSLERVQWFVNVGGYLMTTDWALTKTIEPGFPGYLKQFSGSSTGNDVVVVEDARPGHPFTAGVFDGVPALKWWLEVQAFPMTVIWPERTEVLVDSSEMRQRYGSSPMAATFRWGLGKVQHSISHFYLQEEGMQQAQKPRDRMVFAADNLGLSLDEIRKIAKDKGFDGNLSEETMKKVAPGYSMFRLIVNVVREKSDWVENL
jgi:HEAT repeat protein